MTQRDHTVLASILILIAFFAIRVDTVEIQPWDEGLYAVRGEGITLFDSWADQTQFSLGGLYSSSSPPMASWGVAIGTRLIGYGPLGVRLFTLICSALGMWFLYRILLQIVDPRSALIGVGVLGTSLHWVVYSRQAMTEVPLMMFILGCFLATAHLYAGLQKKTEEQPGLNWKVLLLFAVCFGGALMTKLVVSFVPFLFVLPLLFDARMRKSVGGAVLVGLLLAAPWYVMMYATHGNDWFLSMSLPHLTEAVEGNAGSHGLLYYVNQLIVSQPLIIVAFMFVPLALVLRSLLPSRSEMIPAIALVWFVSGMVVFSLAQTKNPHYVVMLVPAAVIVAVYAYDRVLSLASNRIIVWMYALVVVATLWSLISPLRTSLKLGIFDAPMLIVASVIAVLAIAPMLIGKESLQTLAERGYRAVGYLALGAGLAIMIYTVMAGRPEEIRGGRAVALHLQEHSRSTSEFIYLYHKTNAGDAMNPQLAWYTNGWMSGWREGLDYMPMHMPPTGLDITTLAVAAAAQQPWLVYYHPGRSKDDLDAASEILRVAFKVQLETPHYTLFKRTW